MRLLIVSPEQLHAPLTGGSQRTGYIAAGLARRFETVVIVSQPPADVEQLLRDVPKLRSARWLSIQDDSLRRPRTLVDRIRSRVERWVERRERRRHGLHFRRNPDDKVYSDVLIIARDDGELTTVTMDEFTRLRKL